MSSPQWGPSDPYLSDPYSDDPYGTAAPAPLRPVPAPSYTPPAPSYTPPAAPQAHPGHLAPVTERPAPQQLVPGQVFPRILGIAGGGLKNATWAANKAVADIGAHGERLTADLLNDFARAEQGPTVLHDLRVPSERYTANIDHVMVVGSTVHIIDAKVWKPGFYWTVGSLTFRGWRRFKPAEKKTMTMAQNLVRGYLANKGVTATVVTPRLVIWPSSKRTKLRTWALRIPGARSQSSDHFRRWSRRAFKGGPRATADAAVVAALYELLPSQRRTR